MFSTSTTSSILGAARLTLWGLTVTLAAACGHANFVGQCEETPTPCSANADCAGYGGVCGSSGRCALCAEPDPSLVAWFPMEASGDATTLWDASLNGRAAMCMDEHCPTVGEGHVGGALFFDGADDYFTLAAWGEIHQAGPFTVSVWLNRLGGGCPVNRRYGDVDDNTWQLCIDVTDSEVTYTTHTTEGASITKLDKMEYKMPANAWVHMAMMWTGEVKELYIDGVLRLSVPEQVVAGKGQIIIGSDQNSGRFGPFYQGLIDDVRIYDRALSLQEIQALAAQ